MAIAGSGVYGLTFEKQMKKTQAGDMESTAVYAAMVTDGYTPAYDTHDFFADLTNQVTGGGYTAGGQALAATPSWTVGSPAAGQVAYDSDNPAWASSTITAAMAGVLYHTTGAGATDELYLLSDFVTAASTSNGLFTWQVHANGHVYYDLVP